MKEEKTGQFQTKFVISGTLTKENTSIVKQAYLRVRIPSSFLVSDNQRVAATCTVLTGFSDEITCEIDDTTRNVTYLIVKNGFDSQDFEGTSFSFSIAELQNPLDTKATESFVMEILDKSDGAMYQSKNSVELSAKPSDFAYVHVVSESDVNGDTANYNVSITLGVNTPNNAWLEFNPPSNVEFQDGLSVAKGRGLQNLKTSLNWRSNTAGGRDI